LRMHDGIGPARGRMMLALLAPKSGASTYDWAEAVAAAPARSRVALTETMQGLEAAREQVGTAARVTAIFRILCPLVLSRYSEGPARVEDLDRLSGAAAAWTISPHGSPRSPSTRRYRPETSRAAPPRRGLCRDLDSAFSQGARVAGSAPPTPGRRRIPFDMALTSGAGLAEERRLFYVATTRARDLLTLYTPLRMPVHRRSHNDRHCLAPASRFLSEPVLAALDIQELAPPVRHRDRPRRARHDHGRSGPSLALMRHGRQLQGRILT